MSRSSTVTTRERPVEDAAAFAAGGMTVRGETLVVATERRVEIVDATAIVAAFAKRCGVREGLISLWSMHTTCALFINEFQTALVADIKRFIERLVARDEAYAHNDPAQSDCDRMNADSHLRAMLMGHGLTVQVSGGEIVLGQWQRILLAELDGPRARTLRVQAIGLS